MDDRGTITALINLATAILALYAVIKSRKKK